MKRPVLAFCSLLALGGCGDPEVPGVDPWSKRVPRVARTALGRDVEAWLPRARHRDAAVRAEAAWALGTLSRERAQRAQALARLLRDDDADVRHAALIGAGRTSVPSAAPHLAELLPTKDRAQARRVRQALARAGAAALAPLRPLLAHEDPNVRFDTLWVLLRLGDEAAPAAEDIERLLRSDPERVVRRQAALALGRAGREGPERLAALLRTAKTTRQRMLAERGLGAVSKNGVPVLAALLEGEHEAHADFAATVFAAKPSLAALHLEGLVRALRAEGPMALDAADALVAVREPARAVLRAQRAQASEAHREAIDEVLARLDALQGAKKNAER